MTQTFEFEGFVRIKDDGSPVMIYAPALSPAHRPEKAFPAVFPSEWSCRLGNTGTPEPSHWAKPVRARMTIQWESD